MSKLISGKEALIALANGEDVQIEANKQWVSVENCQVYQFLNGRCSYKFRLKPRNITINGIEVPAPFKPEYGDDVYYLDGKYECGYNNIENCRVKTVGDYSLGFWRTEEEIKQVVTALRKVFEVQP